MLTHLQVKWRKVFTRVKNEANEYFLRPWTPQAHFIIFRRYLGKHQNSFKAITIPISTSKKILCGSNVCNQ